MQRLSKPWTPEEDERVRSFAVKGASALRASAALKRNKHAVVGRARKLGCPFQTLSAARKKWANTPDNPWRG
jgi:ribosome modulation factor